jgi:hypothetical protein
MKGSVNRYSFRVKGQSCLQMLNLQNLYPQKRKIGVEYGSSPLKYESKCGDIEKKKIEIFFS